MMIVALFDLIKFCSVRCTLFTLFCFFSTKVKGLNTYKQYSNDIDV